MWKITVLVFLAVAVLIRGYPRYLSSIPNGLKIPNPCTTAPNDTWRLVGHEIATSSQLYQKKMQQPGSYLNVFGTDFSLESHTWTQKLCNSDSDGDGKSNGEELGDAECVWVKGGKPAKDATGHPGICEEDSPNCKPSAKLSVICA
ncbi:temptin-like [Ostrea edulis]|uniref:temptin-like n=1 Tax=Ostrea edulis TaxID=37623 RepID=UPI002094D491|nr:temptin-like [Ostrea edulis]